MSELKEPGTPGRSGAPSTPRRFGLLVILVVFVLGLAAGYATGLLF